jgi:phosphohistidine phosphatase
MLVGHNPGLENLIRALTGEMQPMPTAALAVIDLETNKWSEVNSSTGKLRTLIRPKEVR